MSMNPIVKNRYLDALLKLMLLSAILHMAVLVVYFIIYRDISRFNFFKIIDIDLFVPELVSNNMYPYSFFITVWLYVFLFYFFTHKK